MASKRRKQSTSAKSNSSFSTMETKGKSTPNEESFSSRFESTLGFRLEDLSSFDGFCRLMHRPCDPSCLAVIRILFGLLMMVDVMEERGLSEADLKWGDPHSCHFPLLNFLRPLPLEWMCLLYLIMWLGAAGVMLGAYFRLSCLSFCLPYWYLFLLDKSAWNNHSYLYGLLSIMFLFSSSHYCWSIDSLRGKAPRNGHVPLWNYAILRFQVFVLYFIAGLKKLDQDWLSGYSMTNLASHWLFDPFRLILTQQQIDYWIVHFFGFLLDLSIGFWLYFDKTRVPALICLTAFHVMNSRIFTIGMFPYVCLATMPLFCHMDWPRKLLSRFQKETLLEEPETTNVCIYPSKHETKDRVKDVRWYHRLTCSILLLHVALQAFLPYSHFLTKGYNNWTNGLYGYSWDMMVHSWDTILVVVKVVDKDSGQEHFLDPQAWTHTDRYSKHGDMMYQYAQCLRDNIQREHPALKNVSIHIDVWCSLNRRFQQRMFDPRVDLLTVDWSPFQPVSWLMPLLTELSSWRTKIAEIEEQVYSWSNYSDVLFVADFPGLYLENYIHGGLSNVSLSVLEGKVLVELEDGANLIVHSGESSFIPVQNFHKVHTISETPSCYMYTYANETLLELGSDREKKAESKKTVAFLHETKRRWKNFMQAANLVGNALLNVLYSVPMKKRVRVN
ncbi:vitamin K-dependent gamma-carboxylase [Macrosteles quadrilineatus]|uniref:vitamin K-dependent gamma-carboxylase n=1 Tax=Macrosteles quadrilineatus TaxID=74068 RepID=UPI0023E189ED|nr:vitamin K-dependent gamma-carboxylase [Macrosteles quadrilineatus]